MRRRFASGFPAKNFRLPWPIYLGPLFPSPVHFRLYRYLLKLLDLLMVIKNKLPTGVSTNLWATPIIDEKKWSMWRKGDVGCVTMVCYYGCFLRCGLLLLKEDKMNGFASIFNSIIPGNNFMVLGLIVFNFDGFEI